MIGRSVFRKSGAGIKPVRARRFDAGRSGVPSVHRSEATGLEDEMNFKWVGPVVLLAALFIGDQIRINRPGHKYRLTVEVETPQGRKSASSVLAVHPDRGYSRGGHTRTVGDAVLAARLRRRARRAGHPRDCGEIAVAEWTGQSGRHGAARGGFARRRGD